MEWVKKDRMDFEALRKEIMMEITRKDRKEMEGRVYLVTKENKMETIGHKEMDSLKVEKIC